MATMDEYIQEILDSMEPKVDPDYIDLDTQAPPPVRLPADEQWVEILADAKDEFEVDGATAVFSTWRVEDEDEFDLGDIQVTDGIEAKAGKIALDARMTDARATSLLQRLPEGEYLLKLKYLRERAEGDWTVEDKFDPVRTEHKKGQTVVTITKDTKPGLFTGIDRPYYQNAYPVTGVVYGLYPIEEADPTKLAPMKDGDYNCVAQRVVEHFENMTRGQ